MLTEVEPIGASREAEVREPMFEKTREAEESEIETLGALLEAEVERAKIRCTSRGA